MHYSSRQLHASSSWEVLLGTSKLQLWIRYHRSLSLPAAGPVVPGRSEQFFDALL